MPKRTHLYDFHRQHGHLVNFAGFEHALWYEGISPEHLAVRNNLGIFDITHMGRCTVKGANAADFLNYIITRDTVKMRINQGRYVLMCNDRGGIIDDLVVFRLKDDYFFLVYNANNREKDYKWISSHAEDFEVQIKDVSDEVVMFAIQGPRALTTLQQLTDKDLSSIRRYRCRWSKLNEFDVLLSRSGYTGEDGFEVYLWNTPLSNSEKAEKLWQTILKAGEEYKIKPCGLGARDTLRLEAGLCLYGNDISEKTTPFEARLDFTVQLTKNKFIGKEALLKQKKEGLKLVRIGLRLLDRGIPRPGYEIFNNGDKIGYLTSGTFSPLLQNGIGMGYVSTIYTEIGTRVNVKIRKNYVGAEIVEMPFYDTNKYGLLRIQ